MRNNLLFLMAILLASCSTVSGDLQQTIVQGIAYDAITSEPLENVLIEVRNERCFISDLGFCEPVNQTILTDKNGFYYITDLTNCDLEITARISNNDKRNFGNALFSFVESKGKIDALSCNENPMLIPGIKYNMDIHVQPRLQIIFRKSEIESIELMELNIPEYDIVITNIDYTFTTTQLNLKSYKGEIEIILKYKDGSVQVINLPYDYFENDQADLKINV